MSPPRPHPAEPAAAAGLGVYLLGVVDFHAALVLQVKLADEFRKCDDLRGACLVCEHPPLITIGRDGSREHVLCDDAELCARRLDVRWLDRGGGCLMHGPGQVALYPVLPIDRLGVGLADFRNRLGAVARQVCLEQRVVANSNAGGAITCRGGQLGQVGVAVRSGISRHGLFLNVSPWPHWQQLVDAGCGRPTSLSIERNAPVSIASVRESLIRHLAREFAYEAVHLFTGHPLLTRVHKKAAYA